MGAKPAKCEGEELKSTNKNILEESKAHNQTDEKAIVTHKVKYVFH